MSDARRRLLANSVTALRQKAGLGLAAVAAVRELASSLPETVRAELMANMDDGRLAARWTELLKEASESPEDGEDVALTAACGLLAWHDQLVQRALLNHLSQLEGDRRHAEGYADGLARALEELGEEAPATENVTAVE